LARAVTRALRGDRARPDDAKGRAVTAPESAPALAAFPCRLGDVILEQAGGEAWLAGALVFRERQPMAILFIAPDVGGDRAVYARPLPQTSLLWLTPVPPEALGVAREPPSALELNRERFERVRRLPFRVERIGTGAPDVGSEVIVAEYEAAIGDRLILVTGTSGVRAWRGRALEEGSYEVLPGKATAD
jgi:hypothetical protein